MAEGIDVILRLFRGEWVTETTDWYTMRDAHTHLRPYTVPHPEVCVASAVTPSGGRLAGKYDLGMLCVAAGERAGFDALATNWQVAVRGRRRGRSGDGSQRPALRAPDAPGRQHASRRTENIRFGAEEFDPLLQQQPAPLPVPEGADYVEWVIEHEIAVVGTPEDAIARIERLYEKQGDFGAVLLQITNWADWPALKRSLELYAQYVIPHFAGANENRQASYAWVTKNQEELVTKRVNAAKQMFARHEAEQAAKGITAEQPEAVNAPTLS